jgi:hypothetical protein
MKRRHLAILAAVIVGQGIILAAQQPSPPPTQGAPAAPRAPQTPAGPSSPKTPAAPALPAPFVHVDPSAGGQPINIRVDVTLIDQTGTAPPQPKTVMVMLVDRALGQTRSVFEDRIINVDARPELRDGRIRVSITVQSAPIRPLYIAVPVTPDAEGNKSDHTLDWRNSFSLLLENGKPMLALESSDQARNRKLSLEVKATIQK